MSGDGCLIEKYNTYKAMTVSKTLAMSLSRAVAKVYRIAPSIAFSKRPQTCIIEGRTVNQKDIYSISFKINPVKKQESFIIDNQIWYPVRSVVKLDKKETVYNMEVENDNSYTANNAIVHNCQEYSMAGNRGGCDTDKGQLMFEAIRSIDEVQPKMFTVENVRGLLSTNNGKDWKAILKDFKSLKGYSISWGIMNAKEQGTPQNRERIFIVGFRSECALFDFPKKVPLKYVLGDLLEDDVDEKYFLSQKMINLFKKKAELSKTDLVQVGNIDTKGHNSLWGRVYSPDGIAPTQNANGGGAGAKTGLFKIKSNTKAGYECAKIGDGISLSRPSSNTRRGRVGKGISQTLDTSSSQGVMVKPTQIGNSLNRGNCSRDDSSEAFCIRASEPNGVIVSDNSKSNIRRLSPREASRVMGDFEDKFLLDGFSDTKLYEFIGNAMDISTTRNLISKMLDFMKSIEISKALDPSFSKNHNNRSEIDLFSL